MSEICKHYKLEKVKLRSNALNADRTIKSINTKKAYCKHPDVKTDTVKYQISKLRCDGDMSKCDYNLF